MMNAVKIRLFSLNSIQNRIFLSILIFLVLPSLVTFTVIGEQLQQSVEEKVDTSRKEALNQAGVVLDIIGNRMINSIIGLTLDENMVSVLKTPEENNEYDKMKISSNAMRALTYAYLSDLEHYITILDFKGGLYTNWYAPYDTYDRLVQEDWFSKVKATHGELIWQYQARNYTTKDSRPLISIARLVQGSGSLTGYGIAMISIPESEFAKLLRSLPGDNLLVDRQGTVISRSNPSSPAAGFMSSSVIPEPAAADADGQVSKMNRGDMVQFNRTINSTDWNLVQYISVVEMYGEIDNIRKMNYLLISAIFLLFTVISIFIALRISRPLKLLNKKMTSIEAAEFNNSIQVKGLDEIAGLIRSYNQMLQQIKALLSRLKSEYETKQELRFKMLKAQINPHFILNTLNNIKWMAYLKNNREVGNMLTSLAVIMETSLGKDESVIRLSKEIEYIRHYATLQKIKYNEKLIVEYELPEALDQCEVIPFILQPIVENGIYHGIEKKKGTGHIRIAAFKEQETLIILIEDDGLGMDEAELDKIRAALEDEDTAAIDRIGISNVHQRIKLHYGPLYGLQIDSREDQGTQVKITLPYRLLEGGALYAESNGRG
jgi:two-component system sensor histidine kinase YesM